jgi:uncharacterized protein (TIGR03437 family)
LVLLAGCRPGRAQETFTVQLPIRLSDAGSNFSLNPFGAHIGNHALDGHPGWDVEYRPGASALAAADGMVQSVFPDPQSGTRTVQIQHRHYNQVFRTVYTNLTEVDPAVIPGAPVAAGQRLGTPATQTQIVGSTRQSWAAIHFQLDDFTVNHGLSNPSAVSPEAHLNAAGREVFAALWDRAAYGQEICEPFPSNSRNVVFPQTRTWTRRSGALAPRIDFTCVRVQADSYRYALLDSNGATMESGAVLPQEFGPDFSAIDLKPDSGEVRRAIVKIVSDVMRIDFGLPGAPRPQDTSRASVYSTPAYPLSLASAASYGGGGLAPESIAAAFGEGLSVERAAASSVPPPATLASTRVFVRDSAGVLRNAALYSVSSGQINFIVPRDAAAGPATVTVTSGDGQLYSGAAVVNRVAPGLFSADGSGAGIAAALVQRVRADGAQSVEPVARFDQGRLVAVPIDLSREDEQVFLALFGTGIRFRRDLAEVRARIGGADVEVVYAGAQPDAPGLDQINLRLSRTLAGSGDTGIAVTVEGIAANAVRISVR